MLLRDFGIQPWLSNIDTVCACTAQQVAIVYRKLNIVWLKLAREERNINILKKIPGSSQDLNLGPFDF